MIILQMQSGTPKFGLWCSDCLLPSVVETPINILFPSGVTTVSNPSRVCRNCGKGRWPE